MRSRDKLIIERMKRDRILELFKLHLENKLSLSDREEFFSELYKMSDSERASLIGEVIDDFPEDYKLSKINSNIIFKRILKKTNIRRKSLIRYSLAAAASLLILFTAYSIIDNIFYSTKETDICVTDIQPGGKKAILTIADGSVINFDDSADSTILEKSSGATIKVHNNKLICKGAELEKIIKYNLLATPRRGEFQMVLPDGTNVKLNAESSIRFPDKFSLKERRVMITGEVYFEVVKLSDDVPFIVECGDRARVEVLGTHFNINSYNDEATIKATLVEGSVRVVSPVSNNSVVITPGQQAQISVDGSLSVKEVDVDEVIAWKNDRFIFEKADIKTIMRQIERWYGVEVEYRRDFNQYFGGAISRKVNISKIFEMFETTGNVKFELKDSLVIVYIIK